MDKHTQLIEKITMLMMDAGYSLKTIKAYTTDTGFVLRIKSEAKIYDNIIHSRIVEELKKHVKVKKTGVEANRNKKLVIANFEYRLKN